MGYRTMLTNDIKLTIHNLYSKPVAVVSAIVKPGKSKTILLRALLINPKLGLDLAELVTAGKIQVLMNNAAYGYVNVLLTATYLASLGTPSAMTYDAQLSGTTLERPLPTSVPVGFMYYNTTQSKPNYNTGALWVDGAGIVS